jgi:hypothetical protein
MAKNVQFRIKVEIVETDEEPTPTGEVEKGADGHFSLVLPETDELNLSALDRAALDLSFPALREALTEHVEAAQKKTAK